ARARDGARPRANERSHRARCPRARRARCHCRSWPWCPRLPDAGDRKVTHRQRGPSPMEEIRPNPPKATLGSELWRFVAALIVLVRDGGVAALVTFLPLGLVGVVLQFASFFLVIMCCTIPLAVPVGALAFAFTAAGPLAAFTLAARGDTVTI